jgi:hypothetical protein
MEAVSAAGFQAPAGTTSELAAGPDRGLVARAGEVRCACCMRTPLVGETAILHVIGEIERWVCELCERSPRKVARLGAAQERIRVRPREAGNVRRLA